MKSTNLHRTRLVEHGQLALPEDHIAFLTLKYCNQKIKEKLYDVYRHIILPSLTMSIGLTVGILLLNKD